MIVGEQCFIVPLHMSYEGPRKAIFGLCVKHMLKKILRKMAVDAVSPIFPRIIWSAWERRGYHVTRINYYSPIPETSALSDDIWKKESELVGIDMNENYQLELLSKAFSKFGKECTFPEKQTNVAYEYFQENRWFPPLDAGVLHCMIRHFQPERVVEIGSGFSTYVSAKASLLNKESGGVECELSAIDPYPNETLKRGFRGLSRLITKRVEQVELSFFSQLRENDILFIDTSHVSRIGGDVNYIYLEILPRLNRGVIIHVHDIFFPKEYPREWVCNNGWFYSEQYILHAFLAFNTAFRAMWCTSYMLSRYKDNLQSVFPNYIHEYADRPACSFWMQRTL
jgi:hypothetical protein